MLRNRVEASDVEMMTGKRSVERMSSSREKTGYESASIKRTKMAEMKDVHEIIDEKEGEKMHLRTLEQRALQQGLQHKMDACMYVFYRTFQFSKFHLAFLPFSRFIL